MEAREWGVQPAQARHCATAQRVILLAAWWLIINCTNTAITLSAIAANSSDCRLTDGNEAQGLGAK